MFVIVAMHSVVVLVGVYSQLCSSVCVEAFGLYDTIFFHWFISTTLIYKTDGEVDTSEALASIRSAE